MTGGTSALSGRWRPLAAGAPVLVACTPPTQALVGLDPSTGDARVVMPLPSDPVALAAGKHALWAASADARMLTRIDPGSRATRRVAVPLAPRSVAVGADAVWVGGSGSPGLTAVDPLFLRPREQGLRRVGWPSSVRALALGDGSVWAGTNDGVVRIDERSGHVLRRYLAEGGVEALAFGGGVLFAGLPSGRILRIDPVSGISARGRVSDWIARLAVRRCRASRARSEAGAANASLQPPRRRRLHARSGDRLLAGGLPARVRDLRDARHLSGSGGTGRAPDRAGARAQPPRGVLQRIDLHVSRPRRHVVLTSVNAPVTAADVKATIERALSPTWPDGPSPGAFLLRDIAGARDYLAGKAGEISGIAVSGDRLTFRLARPVPDLLHRLALPFFCVLPKGAPIVARRTQRPDPDRPSVLPCIGAYRLRPAHHCAAPQSELPR